MGENSTVPVSFRINSVLKKRLDAYSEKFSTTNTDVVHSSLRDYLASTGPTCGVARGRIARGRTAEFAQFVKDHRGTAVYLRIERNNKISVFKGRHPRIYGHHVHLDGISSGWNQGEAIFLLDDVTDWMLGTPDEDVSAWERKNPGLPVDKSWGFTKT
jgi:hypothetical protein